jgi:hypothetical protein
MGGRGVTEEKTGRDFDFWMISATNRAPIQQNAF